MTARNAKIIAIKLKLMGFPGGEGLSHKFGIGIHGEYHSLNFKDHSKSLYLSSLACWVIPGAKTPEGAGFLATVLTQHGYMFTGHRLQNDFVAYFRYTL